MSGVTPPQIRNVADLLIGDPASESITNVGEGINSAIGYFKVPQAERRQLRAAAMGHTPINFLNWEQT